MIAAGASFALVNILLQYTTMKLGTASTNAAFWQYGIAFVFSLPLIYRFGVARLATQYPLSHGFRVACAVIGVQFWVFGLAHVPIWQAIALVMTSPFFVIIGAKLFLGESVGWARWIATLVGFLGAVIILNPWSDSFTPYAIVPVLAALFWAGASVMTKRLTRTESADKVTVYLIALLAPVNAVLAFAVGDLSLPQGTAFWIVLTAGLFTALANWFLARAYEIADASYVQPFDHLKLPLNVLAGWLVFRYVPDGNLWIGALLIVGASLYIMRHEVKN